MPRPPLLAFIACSLDGLIARPGGELDWLALAEEPGEDHGYAAFVSRVDTLVMGRGTFETVRDFPEWPYAGLRAIVLSRTLGEADLPARLHGLLELHSGELPNLLPLLDGAKGVYVDGGQVLQSFIRAELLDELTVTRLPILLGQGRPLFGPLEADVRWEHVQTRVFDRTGTVQSTYRRLTTP